MWLECTQQLVGLKLSKPKIGVARVTFACDRPVNGDDHVVFLDELDETIPLSRQSCPLLLSLVPAEEIRSRSEPYAERQR